MYRNVCSTHLVTHSIWTMTEHAGNLRQELRRGALVLAVLGLLAEPHYGYSLKQRLRDQGIEIDEGTLYPLIRRLELQGLLTSAWETAVESGRKRRYYALSESGRATLQSLVTDWQQLSSSLDALLKESKWIS
jgi:PadR family transcriptional regulator PadR